MISISKLLQRPRPPTSFDRWREVVPPEYGYLAEGKPSPPDVNTLRKWLRSYARWQAGYQGLLEIEQDLEVRARSMDEVDRRHHEYFAALFMQSAQWHAILLMLVRDGSEPERSKHLAEIDRTLAELRRRITKP